MAVAHCQNQLMRPQPTHVTHCQNQLPNKINSFALRTIVEAAELSTVDGVGQFVVVVWVASDENRFVHHLEVSECRTLCD